VSVASFYANENFPLPVVLELRKLGHDVLTIQDSGKANRLLPDREVLALAALEGRCVLTLNRKHFIRLHAEVPSHAGILVCTTDLDFAGQALRIHQAVGELASLASRLIRVNRPGG
jgi:hypothetical protein